MIATVFAGSNERVKGSWQNAARELGAALARAGWTVRTGAGRSPSLMGCVVDGALEAGGKADGVILDRFLKLLHPSLPASKVETSMAARKASLLRGAGAAIVLPGGFGTLDELSDVLVFKQLATFPGPLIVVDLDGYFAPLRRWFAMMRRMGFIRPQHERSIAWVRGVAGVMKILKRDASRSSRGASRPGGRRGRRAGTRAGR